MAKLPVPARGCALFSFCFCLCLNASGGFADEPSSLEASYTAPGDGTETVRQLLTQIETEHLAAQRPLQNLLIHARYGEIGRKAQPYDAQLGFAEPPHDNVPPNRWNPIELAFKDGKRRYQFEATIQAPSFSKHFTGYRLFDGATFAALDESHLELYPQKSDVEADWRSIIPTFYQFQMVFDGNKYASVPSACRTLITWIDSTKADKSSKDYTGYVVQCNKHSSGLITIETKPADATVIGRVASFTVDANKGYQVLRASDQLVGGKRIFKLFLENNVAEIAPQLFYLKSSQRSLFSQEESSSPQWSITALEVNDVAFGDFDYDDKQFDLTSLPIPQGAVVTDHRTAPANQYIYGKPPFNEPELRQALGSPSSSNTSRSRWIVAANALILFSAIGAYLWRRHRSSRRKS